MHVEGRRATLEALRSGAKVMRVRVSQRVEPNAVIDEVLQEARRRHVIVERVEPEVVDALSVTGHHQGVVAEVVPPEPVELERLLEIAAAKGQDPFLVLLDGVEDPQNLGAIARSAEAAGAHGIIITEKHAAGVGPGALRASAGALLLMPTAVVSSAARALEKLKAQGVWVAGAVPEGGKPYHTCDLKGPIVVVIGSEAKGLHRLAQERCDFLMSIPVRGRVESLNASAAAAVLLFEAARQRATAPERGR
jgi:23S rRNA (guanosine2251-2'-O)-methyltransferase